MPPALRGQAPIMLPAAGIVFFLHLIANPHYGFFRDELYFIICGRHPALGYVDQPPLVPLLAALSQAAGPSLILLRAIPAFFAAVAVYATALLAVEFGGGTAAVVLSCVFVACSPVLMAFGARLSPDTVQLALWPIVALLCLRIARGANPRWWLAVGAVAGIDALAKYSIVFFAAALIAGITLSPQRRILATPWFAGGVVLGAAIVAPNAWWQWQHGFPMLALLENDASRPALTMLYPIQQILITGPVFAIAWVAGLALLLRQRDVRFLGFTYLALLLMMWFLHGKNYYMAPVYPYLFAAGSVSIANVLRGKLLAQLLAYAALALSTIASIPFVEPVLPLNAYVAFQRAIGQTLHARMNVYAASDSTPIDYYADMTGWPQLASRVQATYDALPPADRAQAVVFAGNLGEASAIEFFAGKTLPPVSSGNNSYFLWGAHGASGNVVIAVNGPTLVPNYRSVTHAGYYDNPYAMPYENHVRIDILREPLQPLDAYWPRVKDYSYLTNHRVH